MDLNTVYRGLLALDAIALVGIIFVIKMGYGKLFPEICGIQCSEIVWYVLLLGLYALVTYGLLFCSRWLGTDKIEGGITSIEPANNAFLPSYLGYFFVGLSVPNCEVFVFVFGILFVFTFVSQTLYFNPLFLLFGYQFYYVSTENNAKIFIVSKLILRNNVELSFQNLRRITDFTYIDMDGSK